MNVNRSGYYAWQANPESKRQKQDIKFLGLIKQSWLESGSVYGYRKVADDLRDIGAKYGKHRVYKLMKQAKLASQRGYNRRPYMRSGAVAQAAPNRLEQNFTVPQPNQAWVTDITYIRTHEGWLYLAVVIDLFSRQVVGWSMGSRIDTELVINALLMAVWRRKPKQQVIVHSDQGCQFTSKEWQDFLNTNKNLDVNVPGFQSIAFNKGSSRLDFIAHERCENLVGCNRIFYLYAQQATHSGVHGGFPQLLRVHLTQALVPLLGN